MKKFGAAEEEDESKTAAIHRIAAAVGVEPHIVKSLYEQVLAKMREEARIQTFVVIFVERRVKEMLMAEGFLRGVSP